jgi:hypothetical protein
MNFLGLVEFWPRNPPRPVVNQLSRLHGCPTRKTESTGSKPGRPILPNNIRFGYAFLHPLFFFLLFHVVATCLKLF